MKNKNILEKEILFKSSISYIVLHPSYQKIIDMGKDAIVFIMRELKEYTCATKT